MMPVDLKDVSTTFQCVMDIILSSTNCKGALVYREGIVFSFKTTQEHIADTRRFQTSQKRLRNTISQELCFRYKLYLLIGSWYETRSTRGR